MSSDVDPAWRLLCSDIILTLLDALEKEDDGARGQEDVENVHRMRVASRRIRSAMTIFRDCFPSKRFKLWRGGMRMITKALGEARDADVQIGFLDAFRPQVPEVARPGIDLVVRSKRERREVLQGPLNDALEELERRNVVPVMRAFLEEARLGALSQDMAVVRTSSTFERASAEVRERVEELVGHEDCVRQEGALDAHHAMRISAKRLRYTLEAFRPLFDDHLKEELEQIKILQEVLGELHDCDVWVADAEAMLMVLRRGDLILLDGAEGKDIEPGLTYLLEDRTRRRRELYQDFVQLWDGLERKDLLGGLQRRMERAADEEEDQTTKAIDSLIRDPKVKVAVLGDVHGNLQALQAVLKDAKARGATVILNTGDVLGYGANPEGVVRLLRSRPSISVIGNYDLKVFRIRKKKGERADGKPKDKLLSFNWAYEHISPSSRKWVLSLPAEVRLQVGGRRVLMTHGSPDSMTEYLAPGTSEMRLRDIALRAQADLILSGHSHSPMYRRSGKARFLNPGSVGRQDDGDPRASYALLQLSPLRVRLLRVEYDIEGAVAAIRREGLPEEFAQMLLKGRSYDELAGPSEICRGEEERFEAVKSVYLSYLGEDRHTEQVIRLSMSLFDCLSEEMGLERRDGFLLRCGAALHDIGWVEGGLGHHKTSLRMILEEEGLPFDPWERKMVACIARYHRKALPDASQAHFSTLSKADRKKVGALSALLRVADALDCTHASKVGALRCETTSDKIIIHGRVTGIPEMEERDALKKGDLIKRVLGRDLQLLWEVD